MVLILNQCLLCHIQLFNVGCGVAIWEDQPALQLMQAAELPSLLFWRAIRWAGREPINETQVVFRPHPRWWSSPRCPLYVGLCTCLGVRRAHSVFLQCQRSWCEIVGWRILLGKLHPVPAQRASAWLRWFPACHGCVFKHWSPPLCTPLAIAYEKEHEEAVAVACHAIHNGFAVPNMSLSVTGAETAADRRLNCSATADTRIKCEIWKLPHNLHRNINVWHQRLSVLSGMHSHSELAVGRIFLLEKKLRTQICVTLSKFLAILKLRSVAPLYCMQPLSQL